MLPLSYWEAGMLRKYRWLGATWQFEESEAPASAVLIDKAAEPSKPEKTKTKNKSRRTTNKTTRANDKGAIVNGK